MKRSQAIFWPSVAIVSTVFAQTTRPPLQPSAGIGERDCPACRGGRSSIHACLGATDRPNFLDLDRKIQRVCELQAERGAPSLTEEERSLRLELLESIQVAILDVDAVLGEISNERNQLGDLRASLQRRRDKSVGRFTTAALLTGSGVGIAVNATQYSSFSTRTNNAGDTLGIVSGAASMILSVMAARRQKGPNGSVGDGLHRGPNRLGG